VVDKSTSKTKPKRQSRSRTKQARKIKNVETGETVALKAYDRYPEEFRYMAKMLYITGRAGVTEISKQMNIPKPTLDSWHRKDQWSLLRRKVQRLANKDAVKMARKSMSIYIRDIDRGLNKMMTTLNERLDQVDDEHKIKSESVIFKNIMDLWRLKITLVRTLTYGVQGKAFTPHPTNMLFDGTEERANKPQKQLFSASAVEDIMKVIPDYMQEAAKLILGAGPEDWDEDVLDAVTQYLDEINDNPRLDDDDEIILMDNDDDDDDDEEEEEQQ